MARSRLVGWTGWGRSDAPRRTKRLPGNQASSLSSLQSHKEFTLSPLSPSKLLAGGEGSGVRGQIRRNGERETHDEEVFGQCRTSKRASDAIAFARDQRVRANEFARDVWQIVRNRGCRNQKFRREYPIPPYTADFCCVALKLIIEVDGEHHQTREVGGGQMRRRTKRLPGNQASSLAQCSRGKKIHSVSPLPRASRGRGAGGGLSKTLSGLL